MDRCLLLFAALLCALCGHARGQGLDPPGRLGVSPADAEKCDGFKRQDFQALLYGANKLSVSTYALGQPVLPAAQEPSAQDAKDCAVGSTWNQLEMQLHAALSPPAYITDDRKLNPLKASFFPTIRDQGFCHTCVGQAAAAAVQASMATRALEDATLPKFDYDAASLYYCGSQDVARTCKIGWNNLDATTKIASSPKVLTPCGAVPGEVQQPEQLSTVCVRALNSCNKTVTILPNCRYVQLPSFASMQQHIRMYGGLITRVNLYTSVFNKFFNDTPSGTFNDKVLGSVSGSEVPLGHAIMLVGYDNTKMEWTALNSWGPAWGDKGRFKVEMGLAGVGSSTDTFGLICSASGANPPALTKQRAARLKLIPTGTPGVYKHVFNSARTPHLSYLADALNAKLKDIISDNINVLPTKEVVRKEDLTAAEVSQWKCTTQRFFGCIVKIEPANCLNKCQVTRLLLNPAASLNGLRLTIRAPASVATVPTGSTALATLGDVAALICRPGEQASGSSQDVCGVCPANTYKNTTSATACRRCPTGQVTKDSSLPADHDSLDDCVCSPGRELAGDACKVCGANKYKPAAGNKPCTACPAGSLTSGQQPSQHDELADCKCQPGSYMTAAGKCDICPKNTYSDAAGSSQCLACPDSFITAGDTRTDHDSALDCLCPAGYQAVNATSGTPAAQTCVVCPNNTFQASPSLQPCQPCPAGTVTLGPLPSDHNSKTSCTCMAGQYKVGGSCSTCPANTYKTTPGEAACVPCPAGTATFNTTDPSHHDHDYDCRTVYKQMESGGAFSCGVVASNNSVACWGGTPDVQPGTMPVGQLAWKAVTVGGFHACGILMNDTVRCWGRDAQKNGPPDPNLKFSSISAGGYHTCGLLLENSTMRCYANPSYGFSIAGYDSVGQYSQVVSGGGHLCATHVNGSVICWGVALYGQVTVPAMPSVPKQLVCGAYHSGAIFADGSFMIWGGLGVEVGQSDVPAGKLWRAVDLFNLHACGITTDNSMVCWSQDTNGSVDGVPQFVTSWYAVAIGGFFSCGITMGERVVACWGNNDLNQLNVP